MIVNAAVFTCSICGEPSNNICAYCTKDACANHRCERCKRCSDCCECDVPLSASEAVPDLVPELVPAEVFLDPPPPMDPADSSDLSDPAGLFEPINLSEPTEPLA